MQEGTLMRQVFLVVLAVCSLIVLSGCHSGTVRGMGSDVEKLGERMQR